ncbi:MAG: hypothetical protein R3F33_11030 [Planctomycetota bacterium]
MKTTLHTILGVALVPLLLIVAMSGLMTACKVSEGTVHVDAVGPAVRHLAPWTQKGIEGDAALTSAQKANLVDELEVLLELLGLPKDRGKSEQ